MQTYATMQRKKADLSKVMAGKVFDVSMDAQEGALYSVLDDMSDQYIKEQMLAYFLLLKNKYATTQVLQPPMRLGGRSACIVLQPLGGKSSHSQKTFKHVDYILPYGPATCTRARAKYVIIPTLPWTPRRVLEHALCPRTHEVI